MKGWRYAGRAPFRAFSKQQQNLLKVYECKMVEFDAYLYATQTDYQKIRGLCKNEPKIVFYEYSKHNKFGKKIFLMSNNKRKILRLATEKQKKRLLRVGYTVFATVWKAP